MAPPSPSTGPSEQARGADVRRLRRWERLLLAGIWTLAAVGWVVVARQSAAMGGAGEMGVDLTLGMTAPLFLGMWVAMMAAMMLPASAPMVLAFARSQSRRRGTGGRGTPTWLFVAPYLAIWTGFGVLCYALAVAGTALVGDSMRTAEQLSRATGVLLALAGTYQLSPLKGACLVRCRTPFTFMLRYWRDGRWGAVTMGFRHGVYCLGCCWLLFLLLVPLGVMNVVVMVALAGLVLAEKTLPHGDAVAKLAGVALAGYGLLALGRPDLLPPVT